MLERITGRLFVVSIVLAICSVWVCVNAAEPPALARLSGADKARVAKLIEGAKKEGELVAYMGTWRPDFRAKMEPAFLKDYGLSKSDLKLNIISLRSGATVTKVTEELRAKVYKTDIVQGPVMGWLDDLADRKELMAYASPEWKNLDPIALDPIAGSAYPPYYVATYFSTYGLAYNPKYVKGEILHWKDVLRPEYKGKIVSGNVDKSDSYTNGYVSLRQILDKSFWRDLGKQDPFMVISGTDAVNKATSGEYPIMVLAIGALVSQANWEGAGLKMVLPPEGFAGFGASTAILAHAPHPNASKLLIDFLHSAIGQYMILNEGGYVVGRLGVKAKHDFPRPVSEMKGFIKVDWSKVTNQDRDNFRAEFRRLVIEKKDN